MLYPQEKLFYSLLLPELRAWVSLPQLTLRTFILSLMVVCKYIQSTYWHCPWLFTWPDYEGEYYEEEVYEFDEGDN